MQRQEFYTARHALEEVVRRCGYEHRAYVALVRVAESAGDIDSALCTVNLMLEKDSANPDLMLKKADLLDKSGLYKDAAELIGDIRASYPRQVKPAAMAARIAYNQGENAQALEFVHQALQVGPASNAQRSECFFLQGRIYDRMGDPDNAMHAFMQGNRLNCIPFDRESYLREIDGLIEFHAPPRLDRLQRSNSLAAPIFILSLPRSGTSLVHQILDMHPETLGLGEAGWLVRNRLRMAQEYPAGFPGHLELVTSGQLDVMADSYFRGRVAPDLAGIVRTIDKSVENYRDAGFIWQLFPAARLIFLQRNPVDCCLSIFMSRFVTHRTKAYSSRLDDIAHVYRQHQRLKRHWREVLDMPILELDYEQLVSSPEEKIHELVEFCGLPWDDHCLRYYESRKKVNTMSYAQVSRPIYKDSIGRGERYHEYTVSMREILGRPFDGCT